MTIKWDPVVDRLAFLIVLVVDIAKSLFLRFQPFSLKFDNLLAEAVPEFALSISSDPVPLALRLNIRFVFDVIFIAEISLELLAPVEDTGTLTNRTGLGILVAAPSFDLIMLSVFVTFPVILAPELLGAAWERAAIGAGVPFFVFPSSFVSQRDL